MIYRPSSFLGISHSWFPGLLARFTQVKAGKFVAVASVCGWDRERVREREREREREMKWNEMKWIFTSSRLWVYGSDYLSVFHGIVILFDLSISYVWRIMFLWSSFCAVDVYGLFLMMQRIWCLMEMRSHECVWHFDILLWHIAIWVSSFALYRDVSLHV